MTAVTRMVGAPTLLMRLYYRIDKIDANMVLQLFISA